MVEGGCGHSQALVLRFSSLNKLYHFQLFCLTVCPFLGLLCSPVFFYRASHFLEAIFTQCGENRYYAQYAFQ